MRIIKEVGWAKIKFPLVSSGSKHLKPFCNSQSCCLLLSQECWVLNLLITMSLRQFGHCPGTAMNAHFQPEWEQTLIGFNPKYWEFYKSICVCVCVCVSPGAQLSPPGCVYRPAVDDYCYIGDCNHKTFPPAPALCSLCLGWSSSIWRVWSPSPPLQCPEDPSCSQDAEVLQVSAIPGSLLGCSGSPSWAQCAQWMLLTAARRRHCRQGRGAAGGWMSLPAALPAPSDGGAETAQWGGGVILLPSGIFPAETKSDRQCKCEKSPYGEVVTKFLCSWLGLYLVFWQ